MNLQAVRKLVKLNLLYAVAPAQLAAYRQKQEKNPLKKIDIPKKQPEYYISDNRVIEYVGSAKDGRWIVKTKN